MVQVQWHSAEISPPSTVSPASAGTPPSNDIDWQVVVAFGRDGHGAGSCTQKLVVLLQLQRPAQAVVSRRSHTPSPGVHGSIATQFIVGSQNSFIGQFESSGVWTHAFVIASQLSVVHGTPSSQLIGMLVATQKPPRHAWPLFPAQMFGPVQSLLWTHVCCIPPSELPELDPVPLLLLLVPLPLLPLCEPLPEPDDPAPSASVMCASLPAVPSFSPPSPPSPPSPNVSVALPPAQPPATMVASNPSVGK
jgi:hypothetical protein